MSRIQAAIEGGKFCDISLWVGFKNNRAMIPNLFPLSAGLTIEKEARNNLGY